MNALIDRYIHRVREHLPAPLRDDIARELESLILDTLDDRARQRGLTLERGTRSRAPGSDSIARERQERRQAAAPGLDLVGRLAVAVIAVNGVVLLGCSGYWLWTIVQPSKPIVLARPA